MKKKYGKNEASGLGTKNTVIMIVSILSVGLFIGMAIEPVMSGTVSKLQDKPATVEEECLPCKVNNKIAKEDKIPCKTCGCAVNFAVNYMRNYVNDSLANKKLPYPGWFIDLNMFILLGLIEGFNESHFTFTPNQEKLEKTINYWVNKFLNPQQEFNITKIIMAMVGISAGLIVYLKFLCNNGHIKGLPSPIQLILQFIHSKIILLLQRINILIKEL